MRAAHPTCYGRPQGRSRHPSRTCSTGNLTWFEPRASIPPTPAPGGSLRRSALGFQVGAGPRRGAGAALGAATSCPDLTLRPAATCGQVAPVSPGGQGPCRHALPAPSLSGVPSRPGLGWGHPRPLTPTELPGAGALSFSQDTGPSEHPVGERQPGPTPVGSPGLPSCLGLLRGGSQGPGHQCFSEGAG